MSLESIPHVFSHPFVRRFLPAAAFFGGFLWDALTLGRSITALDLWLLLGYYLAAAVCMILIGREVEFRFSERLDFALQFLFGGIFSALVIFYFLSAGEGLELVLVVLLSVLLVGNEFLESRYSRLTLSLTFFGFCGVMFLNFAIPHLVGSIHPIWFYVSTLIALVLTLLVRQISRSAASMVPTLVVAIVLVAFHAFNAIPPVPLVKKEMLVAHALERTADHYVMTVEPPTLWRFWRTSSVEFHIDASGGPVYCFTSVFVPRGISTTIAHHWQRWDERRKSWVTTDRLSFEIRGGRSGGFRGYTRKVHVTAGRWRVKAEAESGATLALLDFEIVKSDAPPVQRTLRR